MNAFGWGVKHLHRKSQVVYAFANDPPCDDICAFAPREETERRDRGIVKAATPLPRH